MTEIEELQQLMQRGGLQVSDAKAIEIATRRYPSVRAYLDHVEALAQRVLNRPKTIEDADVPDRLSDGMACI